MSSQKSSLNAGEKQLTVIEALDALDGGGVTEISEHTDLPKSTVHYYLNQLKQNRFITVEDDEYQLGLRFLELGIKARRRTICQTVRPELKKLAERTGELTILMVPEYAKGVFLDVAMGEDAVKLDARVGKREYLHNTALGKAILAKYSDTRIHDILDEHGIPQTTKNTITDRNVLFEELTAVREDDIAFDDQELVEGLKCVAAPIMRDETVRGAVGVAAPMARMENERFKEAIPKQLRRVINVVELELTYS